MQNHGARQPAPQTGPIRGPQRLQSQDFPVQWSPGFTSICPMPLTPPESPISTGQWIVVSVQCSTFSSAGTETAMATPLVKMLLASPREEHQSPAIAPPVLGWTQEAALKPWALLCPSFCAPLSATWHEHKGVESGFC